MGTPITGNDPMINFPKQKSNVHGGIFMGQFTEIMAVVIIMFTAVMLLVQNIIEDRQEKNDLHEEVKKRWRETEKPE